MSNASDFIIENGVLKRYVGSDKAVGIPSFVTRIGDHAFAGCGRVETVVIPEGVTDIGVRAFSECNKLTSVKIPESVTSIGKWAFHW